MTPEQRRALVQACEDGDEVRIVTLALQIAASLARAGDQPKAMAIRRAVDDHQAREEREQAHQRMRDEFAKVALAGILANPGTLLDCSEAWACKRSYVVADLMIKERGLRTIPASVPASAPASSEEF